MSDTRESRRGGLDVGGVCRERGRWGRRPGRHWGSGDCEGGGCDKGAFAVEGVGGYFRAGNDFYLRGSGVGKGLERWKYWVEILALR